MRTTTNLRSFLSIIVVIDSMGLVFPAPTAIFRVQNQRAVALRKHARVRAPYYNEITFDLGCSVGGSERQWQGTSLFALGLTFGHIDMTCIILSICRGGRQQKGYLRPRSRSHLAVSWAACNCHRSCTNSPRVGCLLCDLGVCERVDCQR